MKKIAIAIAGVFLVSGCATPGKDGGQGQNAATGAAMGALAGCGLAVLLGGKCAEGAVIGGVAGAVIGWSYESKKVETAASVNARARQAGEYVPNDKVELRGYDITSNTKSAKQGGVVVSDSTIKLVGNSNIPPEVKETLVLVHPDGKRSKPQVATVEAVDGAGVYKSTGKFSVPQGFPQGMYKVDSQLSVNNTVAANRSFNFQVVHVDGIQVVHLALAE